MIPDRMQEAMSDQVNAELYSAYIYLAMAAYFEDQSLPGFANWMRCQSQEEVVHAMKFCHHINERGGRVRLKAIEGPPTAWESPLAAFEAAYQHEQHISGRINSLVDLAAELKDHAAGPMLQWFVAEQVEEEAGANEVVQLLKRSEGRPHALLMIDRELGKRTFRAPASGGDEG